jgi:uncharacterized membrane protein YkoI
MTNAQRISKAARLTIAGAGVVAVLGAGAAAASAATPLAATTTTLTPATSAASASTDSASTVSASTDSASTASASTVTAATARITRRQAIRIAQRRVPGARVTEVEREWEHGRRVWKVELKKHHAEYRVYISTNTGKIVRFRQKHDD